MKSYRILKSILWNAAVSVRMQKSQIAREKDLSSTLHTVKHSECEVKALPKRLNPISEILERTGPQELGMLIVDEACQATPHGARAGCTGGKNV